MEVHLRTAKTEGISVCQRQTHTHNFTLPSPHHVCRQTLLLLGISGMSSRPELSDYAPGQIKVSIQRHHEQKGSHPTSTRHTAVTLTKLLESWQQARQGLAAKE